MKILIEYDRQNKSSRRRHGKFKKFIRSILTLKRD